MAWVIFLCLQLGNVKAQDHTVLNKMLDSLTLWVDQNPTKALDVCREGLALNKSNGNPYYDGKFYGYMGIVYQSLGAYKKSDQYLNLSKEAAEKVNDTRARISAMINLGGNSFYQGNHSAALKWFIDAAKDAEKSKDASLLGSIEGNIAAIYIESREELKALPYYHRAISHFISIHDSGSIARCYQNLGQVHITLNNMDSSQFYLNKALSLSLMLNQSSLTGRIYMDMASRFQVLKQLTQADIYFNKSLTELEKVKDINQWVQTLCKYADNLQELGNKAEALKQAEKALTLAQKSGSYHWMQMAAKTAEKIAEKQGDFKGAYQFASLAGTYRDSIISEAKTKELQNATVAFETEKREQEILQLQENEAQQKKFYTLIIISSIILILAVLIIAYIIHRNKKKTEKLNLALAASNKVKDKMFSVISHDLRSPLNRLQNYLFLLQRGALSIENQSQMQSRIQQSLSETSSLLDELLWWAGRQMDGFQIQKKIIQPHVYIREILSSFSDVAEAKKIKIICQAEENEIEADPHVFQLIYRNLLSNAIKFSPVEGTLNIRWENSILTIMDEGKGISNDWILGIERNDWEGSDAQSTPGTIGEKGSGFGLRLCLDFLKNHGGTLHAERMPNQGTKFTVRFSS